MTYYAQSKLGAFKEANGTIEQIFVSPFDGIRPVKVAWLMSQKLQLMGQYLDDTYEYEYVPLGSCSLKIV